MMAKWRRGGGRQRFDAQGLAWNAQEADQVAMAGGVTAAYRCQVVDGWLRVNYQAALRSQCAESLDLALQRLQAGEIVTVAGCDMALLRTRLAQNGVGQAA